MRAAVGEQQVDVAVRVKKLHFTIHGRAGQNSYKFSGKGLKPGKYTLTLTPAGGSPSSVKLKVRR